MLIAHSNDISEELWITLNKPGWKKTIIGLIYRPPSRHHDPFIERIGETLGKINTHHNIAKRDLIVIGDNNIDFSKNGNPARKWRTLVYINILTLSLPNIYWLIRPFFLSCKIY